MATTQLVHVGQTHGTSKEAALAALFPSRVVTEQQSMVLVKRLLAISVSCITYLRGLFPESSYGTRYLDDMCLKILREDKSCQASLQIVKWIRGCFDALEKNYLHMAVLAIFTNPKEPECVTELYRFKFKYSKYGPQMDFGSTQVSFANGTNSEETKKASILLIRKLYVLMQNLGPLPNDITLTMKLFYYNDVTPNDYQPPGFKEGSAPDCLIFDGDPVNLKVGSVSTGFHVLKVRVTTESKRMGMLESSMAEENGSTEISHQGLDCDEEEEEGSMQNSLQAIDVELDKNRTCKGDEDSGCKNVLSLKPNGEEAAGKTGVEKAERGPRTKTSHQQFEYADSLNGQRTPAAVWCDGVLINGMIHGSAGYFLNEETASYFSGTLDKGQDHVGYFREKGNQTRGLDLESSQEKDGGLSKRRKVSEPINQIPGSQK